MRHCMEICICNSGGHAKAWRVHIPNRRGDAKVWASISPTGGPTKAWQSMSATQGPWQSEEICIFNSKTQAIAWESVTLTPQAKPKCRTPHLQLKGPRLSAGVRIPN